MDFLSLGYIAFVLCALILYYLLPGRHRWKVLLIANAVFYLVSGKANIIFIIFTGFTVWLASVLLGSLSDRHSALKKAEGLSRDDKKLLKKKFQNYKRCVLWAAILVNFGILAAIKYFGLLKLAGGGLLMPLGISFYTFQAAGYLIDVYGDKYPAEKSFPRFMLFVSFFPQLIQGPINRYDKLESQFFKEQPFDIERVKRALLLILYGLMKKYAIADMLSGSISMVLDDSIGNVSGLMIVLSILMYSAQQYADFSGGIDIVLGVSSLFGIDMMPNFKRPYFSTSLGDFWRRWHISLGAFMRDYVFYPFALLKGMQNFGKFCSKRFGKHFGRVLPAAVANILVFFLVGIWHGASLHYVFWGLYNGIVIALSDILEPVFSKASAFLHINTESRKMHIFRAIRTFIIVNIGWYFDRIEDFGQCLAAFRDTLLRFNITELPYDIGNTILNPDVVKPMYVLGGMAVAAVGIIAVFAVSLAQEQGKDVDLVLMEKKQVGYGLAALFCCFMILVSFVFTTSTGGFLYANF